jgi:hypothetical protein
MPPPTTADRRAPETAGLRRAQAGGARDGTGQGRAFAAAVVAVEREERTDGAAEDAAGDGTVLKAHSSALEHEPVPGRMVDGSPGDSVTSEALDGRTPPVRGRLKPPSAPGGGQAGGVIRPGGCGFRA